MIELLILHQLNQKVLTMYGISKDIRLSFSVLTTPSYGTIKPALNRLEKAGFVKTQKTMTSGGRPSTYYSITNDGVEELKSQILAEPLENPIQFLTTACEGVLSEQEQLELFKSLKLKSEMIMIETKNLIQERKMDYLSNMVFDNLICEYKNFNMLLEGFERACKN